MKELQFSTFFRILLLRELKLKPYTFITRFTECTYFFKFYSQEKLKSCNQFY